LKGQPPNNTQIRKYAKQIGRMMKRNDLDDGSNRVIKGGLFAGPYYARKSISEYVRDDLVHVYK
jgi:hypothetical protein